MSVWTIFTLGNTAALYAILPTAALYAILPTRLTASQLLDNRNWFDDQCLICHADRWTGNSSKLRRNMHWKISRLSNSANFEIILCQHNKSGEFFCLSFSFLNALAKIIYRTIKFEPRTDYNFPECPQVQIFIPSGWPPTLLTPRNFWPTFVLSQLVFTSKKLFGGVLHYFFCKLSPDLIHFIY